MGGRRHFAKLAATSEFIPEKSNTKSEGYSEGDVSETLYVFIKDLVPVRRNPHKHFDEPLTIKGEIPAKFLYRVNSNAGEAIILAKDVKHLKVTSREVEDTQTMPFALRKKAISPYLPPGYCWDGGKKLDLETMLFDKVKDQYGEERLDRIRKLIYRLY